MDTIANAAYNLTPITEAIIALIVALISCLLIPYLKSKFNAEQLAQLSHWIQVAVAAAEQLFKEPGAGAAKKQYVLSFLQTKGYPLDDEKLKSEINALVENAVFELNKKP